MSTIRYTRGGDYDSKNSQKLDTSFLGSPLDAIYPYFSTFYIHGPNGEYITGLISNHDDGIYADFSDNTTGAAMHGGDRGDIIIGGSASDLLYGGSGDDVIVGGAGRDRVYGGIGADTIVFNYIGDFPIEKKDLVLDFSGVSGDGDKIDMTAIADFAFVGDGRFGADGVAEIRAKSVKSGYIVSGDVDGDGVADFRIKVVSDAPLTASDFSSAMQLASPHTGFADPAHFIVHSAFSEPLHGLAPLALA